VIYYRRGAFFITLFYSVPFLLGSFLCALSSPMMEEDLRGETFKSGEVLTPECSLRISCSPLNLTSYFRAPPLVPQMDLAEESQAFPSRNTLRVKSPELLLILPWECSHFRPFSSYSSLLYVGGIEPNLTPEPVSPLPI